MLLSINHLRYGGNDTGDKKKSYILQMLSVNNVEKSTLVKM